MLIDPGKLVSAQIENYNAVAPYPHAILDNLFNEKFLRQAAKLFPTPSQIDWYKYDNRLEKKLATPKLELVDPIFTQIFYELNSSVFVRFLEKATGISGLIPDPHLNGGGLHLIEREGKLSIHADYNYHPETGLDRRVNILVYLNENWQDSWGGHLELWNKEMTLAVAKAAPVFNRAVIFNVSDLAYHGHPEPLQCPENEYRKSIACYYYTKGRPEHEVSAPHSTLYQVRPGDPMDEEIVALRAKRAKGRIVLKPTTV